MIFNVRLFSLRNGFPENLKMSIVYNLFQLIITECVKNPGGKEVTIKVLLTP
jgi:hypothetical protein